MPGLKLYWDSVPNAVSYNVYWRTSPGVTIGNGNLITNITNIVYHHTGLLEDTVYYYIVAAVDAAGNIGPASTEFSAQSSNINGIAIQPTGVVLLAGQTQQYTSNLVYSSGGIVDVTALTAWDTSDHGTATISATGLATAVQIGNVNILASYDGYSTSIPLEIHHTLLSIVITPSSPTVNVGGTTQLTATGYYNDSTNADLTTQVTWGSSDVTKATVDAYGVAHGVFHGTTLASAFLGSIHAANVTLTVNAVLQSISVTPHNPTVVYPNTQQFTATGTYNDTSTADLTNTASWSSTQTSVATINSSGLITPVLHGSTTISATVGLISGTSNATITNALVSLAVTPNPATIFYAGNTLQFTATGIYNDSSTQDLTGTSTWASSVPGVATINSATGLATAVAIGSTTITAQNGAITSSAIATVPSWTLQSNPGGTDVITTVVGNSDGQVIAGGHEFSGTPLIYRWDGITWGTVLRANIFSSQDAVATTHVSLDNTTFFATTSHNMAKSTDGGVTWYQLTDPVASGGLAGCAAIDANTIWTYSGIFGTSNFYQSLDGGSTWASMSAGQTDTIVDFFTLNANSIYAFGRNSAGTAAVIWHWNGTSWTKLTTSWTNASTTPLQTVTCMWGDADNNMYAAGVVGSSTTPHVLIRSTDQFATFIPQTLPVSVTTINGLDGYTGADNLHKIIYATGSGRTNFEIYKHQPGIDSAETFVDAGAAFVSLQSAQDVWVNPTTLRAVAVGAQTTEQFGIYTPTLTTVSILPTTSSTRAFQQFYATGTFSNGDVRDVTNSVTWHSSNTSAATISAAGLATSIADNGTTNITATYSALTSNTAVMNTNIWVQQASGTVNKLNKVWGFSSTNIYAVGNTGTILHWNGSGWSTQTIATSDNILGIHGPDASNIYIFTDTNHVYVSHDGSTWTQKTNPGTGSSITAIWANSSTDIWIGAGGRYVHSADDGGTWTADVGNVANIGLTSFIGFSSSEIWSGHGGQSEIQKYDGVGTNGNAWHDWPNTTLAVAINSGSTSMTLTNASVFPKVGKINIDQANGSFEVISYTGKTGNILTGLTRGLNFTTATSHNIGAFITGTNAIPSGFGTSAVWGTSSNDLFFVGAFFNGGGAFYSTDKFATITGIGPDNGFVPSNMSPIAVSGGNNFVYVAGLTASNHFAIMSYDRGKNQWTSTFDQNISTNSARALWTDSSTGYTVAVGDGGTIVKKG